jgi:hypothetical protein
MKKGALKALPLTKKDYFVLSGWNLKRCVNFANGLYLAFRGWYYVVINRSESSVHCRPL